MQPTVMSQTEAQALLAPYLPKIRTALEEGWREWRRHLDGNSRATAHRPSTRANMVYDWTVAAAEREFDGDPAVKMSKKSGFLTLTIGSGPIIRVRFKKYSSKSLRTSGIPTQQRIAFENQWLEIDGLRVTDVVAGYLLDRAAVEQDRLAVTCPLGGGPLWAIDLDGEVAEVQPIQQLPLDDGPVVRSASKKQTKKSKDQTEGS